MTAKRSVVLGCGSYLPQKVLTNAELAARIDTSDEWIVQRTGIRQRHIAAEGEFTSHLAINAARAEQMTNIVMVGHLTDLASVRETFRLVGLFYGATLQVPEFSGFATATGALLEAQRTVAGTSIS